MKIPFKEKKKYHIECFIDYVTEYATEYVSHQKIKIALSAYAIPMRFSSLSPL